MNPIPDNPKSYPPQTKVVMFPLLPANGESGRSPRPIAAAASARRKTSPTARRSPDRRCSWRETRSPEERGPGEAEVANGIPEGTSFSGSSQEQKKYGIVGNIGNMVVLLCI